MGKLKGRNTFDEVTQDTASNILLTQAEHQMSTDLKSYITKNIRDITGWIISQIEVSLYNLKKS